MEPIDETEFVSKALKRLPAIPMRDLNAVVSTLSKCSRQGYTLQDAINYAKHTEEVSPDMPEEYALAKLSEIAQKYQ